MHKCGNSPLFSHFKASPLVNCLAWHSRSPMIWSQSNSPSIFPTTLPFLNPPDWGLSSPRTGSGIPPLPLFLMPLPPEMTSSCLDREPFYPAWYAYSPVLGPRLGVPRFSIATPHFHTKAFVRIASISWVLTIGQVDTLLEVYILSSHQPYKVGFCFAAFLWESQISLEKVQQLGQQVVKEGSEAGRSDGSACSLNHSGMWQLMVNKCPSLLYRLRVDMGFEDHLDRLWIPKNLLSNLVCIYSFCLNSVSYSQLTPC